MRQLKPTPLKPRPVTTPQCDALANVANGHDHQWREKWFSQRKPGNDPMRCQRVSAFEIEGKCYCRLHAGIVALEMWTDGRLVEAKQ